MSPVSGSVEEPAPEGGPGKTVPKGGSGDAAPQESAPARSNRPTISVRLAHRIGGPLGRHARPGGLWFDPAPWALLLSTINWVLLLWRQAPCQQYTFGKPVNPFLRLCYSDIPVFFQNNGIGSGAGIYSDAASPLPVLVGYLASLDRFIIRLLGAGVGPDASGQAQLDSSYMFFVLAAIGLFCAFLALVLAHLQMGRDSFSDATRGVRVRSFDALLIAIAPVVFTGGLISWQLLPVALTSLAVWAWARKLPVVSGVLFGLAVGADAYPVLVVLAVVVLCIRAARMREALRMLVPGIVAWVALNLPVVITAPHGWTAYWSTVLGGGSGVGSFWYALQLLGVSGTLLGVVASVFVVIAVLAVVWLVFTAPRRPRLGQVAFLLVAAVAVFGPHYSPQYALWLLPLLVLARPKVLDWAAWNVAEVLYWLAIWGYLEGILGAGSGADALYWLAVLLRIGVVLWVASRVIGDMFSPWNDPIRRPFVDDPVGGVLDHAVDAPWLAEAESDRKKQAADQSGPVDEQGASEQVAATATMPAPATTSDADMPGPGTRDEESGQ